MELLMMICLNTLPSIAQIMHSSAALTLADLFALYKRAISPKPQADVMNLENSSFFASSGSEGSVPGL
jgi:hypothetical protein